MREYGTTKSRAPNYLSMTLVFCLMNIQLLGYNINLLTDTYEYFCQSSSCFLIFSQNAALDSSVKYNICFVK